MTADDAKALVGAGGVTLEHKTGTETLPALGGGTTRIAVVSQERGQVRAVSLVPALLLEREDGTSVLLPIEGTEMVHDV